VLTLYFLLTIRYRWTDRKCKQKAELWMHLLPLGIGWGGAILGLPLKLYNPVKFSCWVTGFPFGCDSKGTCTRGVHAAAFSLFLYGCVWGVLLWIIIAMLLIYQSVANTEKASLKFRTSAVMMQHGAGSGPLHSSLSSTELNNHNNNSSSGGGSGASPSLRDQMKLRRAFAVQALLYCISYVLTWFFVTISSIMLKRLDRIVVWMSFLSSSMISLQGFYNAMIYIRPRYIRYRQGQLRAQELRRRQRQQYEEGGSENGDFAPRNASIRQSRWDALVQAMSVDDQDDDDDGDYDDIVAVGDSDDHVSYKHDTAASTAGVQPMDCKEHHVDETPTEQQIQQEDKQEEEQEDKQAEQQEHEDKQAEQQEQEDKQEEEQEHEEEEEEEEEVQTEVEPNDNNDNNHMSSSLQKRSS
jgi:hypothetical protein